MSWKDFPSLLSEFYALVFLLGTLLVVIAVAETVKFGAWIGIKLQSKFPRIALFTTGCVFIVLALTIYFMDRRPSTITLDDEKAIHDYYSAIDSKTPEGYQRAWELLTASKQHEKFQDNPNYFKGLFRTTDHHEAVFLYPQSRTDQRSRFYEIMIVIDEYPYNPVTQQLSRPSVEIITTEMLDDITTKVMEALNTHYDMDGQVHSGLRQSVTTFIASKPIPDLIAPDLLEQIALNESMKSYNFTLRKSKDPTTKPTNQTKRVIVNQRTVVNEKAHWRLDHADTLAVAVLP